MIKLQLKIKKRDGRYPEMKKLLTVFIIFVYTVPVSFLVTVFSIYSFDETEARAVLGVSSFFLTLLFLCLVCLLVAINIFISIVFAVQFRYLSFKTVMMFKLSLIPFYVLNFICWLICSLAFHLALIVLPFLPFIITYTYFTILATSSYNINKLFALCQNKKISVAQFVIHFILQIVFVTDLIDTVYLTTKQNKFESIRDTPSVPTNLSLNLTPN